VNGDNPELVAESNLLPEEAITAHRNSNGFNSQIIHIGGQFTPTSL
jgi:hypothetical protein